MVSCSRCGQSFDETRFSVCPQCKTPVTSATPQLNVPTGNPNVRVSLTGEVIESAPPPIAANPAGIARPTAPGSMQSGAAARPGASPAGSRHPGLQGVELQRELVAEQEGKRARNHVLNTILGVIVFLVVAGGGGWYYYTHRTNPKDAALAYFKALGKQDWKALYDMTAFSDADSKSIPDADTLSKTMNAQLASSPFIKQVFDAIGKGAETAQAGDPTIDGDKATVPITWSLDFMGRTTKMNGTAHMINKGGWKFDATGGSMQASQELIGKPSM